MGAGAAIAATNSLATALLPVLGGASDNAVFSPYSIATALAMVDQGAAGDTEAQIDQVLGAATSPAELASASQALAQALTAATTGHGPSAPTLAGANALWLASGLTAEPAFVGRLTDAFAAPPQRADFASDSEGARAAINSWAASHTDGKIPQLMPAGSISPATVLVLADALYLKARWENPFTPSRTTPGRFRPASGPAVRVPYMSFATPANLQATVTGDDEAVELPYAGSTLSMLAVMPRAGTMAAFERGLQRPNGLADVIAGLRPGPVRLRMPRLRLRLSASLAAPLSSLGMPDAFGDNADFSGIAAGRRLRIQAAEHAARLEVDEAGTVAAAATGISVAPTAILGGRSRTISLDHPFLLFLRDQASGVILFAARVENPLAP